MSKRIFTEKEIKLLSANKYVQYVSSKGITYTDEFKHIFIAENEKGKLPREIFEECGFDIEIIGLDRVRSSGKRWRAAYRENGVAGYEIPEKINQEGLVRENLPWMRNTQDWKLKIIY